MNTLRNLLNIDVLLLRETNVSSNLTAHMNPAVIPYVLKKSSKRISGFKEKNNAKGVTIRKVILYIKSIFFTLL